MKNCAHKIYTQICHKSEDVTTSKYMVMYSKIIIPVWLLQKCSAAICVAQIYVGILQCNWTLIEYAAGTCTKQKILSKDYNFSK